MTFNNHADNLRSFKNFVNLNNPPMNCGKGADQKLNRDHGLKQHEQNLRSFKNFVN